MSTQPGKSVSRSAETIPPSGDGRTERILAKTLHRELRQSGLDGRAVLAVTTELLALVAEDLRGGS